MNNLVDLLIVGGGINGVGIARDAAGRGLSVALCEQGDLACATSSASTKLIHGGLRYLEHFQFRMVAEALAEREVLLKNAPHIISPLTFVLPWAAGLRPAWMLRLGLKLYDRLGGTVTLPRSRTVELASSQYGSGLVPGSGKGFAYSDCRVDDVRLVVLNARAAADFGAQIHTRTRCLAARREGKLWLVKLQHAGEPYEIRCRALVNAGGPWVKNILNQVAQLESRHGVRLVQGSHIVVPRLYSGEHAYLLQNHDRRVILAIPYLERYTLIGTTEVPYHGDPNQASISREEIVYLCAAANRYFTQKISPENVVWGYSGVRALYDDGSANPSRVTRDYKLALDGAPDQAPLLSVFGGKITTYRKLAEHALEKLKPWFSRMQPAWTADHALPGGDIPQADFERFAQSLAADYPQLPPALLRQLAQRHGTLLGEVLSGVRTAQDLGQDFGAGLYQREVDYFIEREWARTTEDILWRRTKAGLFLGEDQRAALEKYLALHRAGRVEA